GKHGGKARCRNNAADSRRRKRLLKRYIVHVPGAEEYLAFTVTARVDCAVREEFQGSVPRRESTWIGVVQTAHNDVVSDALDRRYRRDVIWIDAARADGEATGIEEDTLASLATDAVDTEDASTEVTAADH